MKTIKFLAVLVFGTMMVSCQSNTYDEIGGYVDNPTYEANIKPIFANRCVTCHYTDNPEYIADYSDYTSARESVEFGRTLRDIDTLGTMPKNDSRLSNSTIKMIYKWKENGFPEN